jgi:hypothetical protein
MKDEIEESGLGPWKWGGQKHNRVHGRAASVEKGVHEWRMKNADTTLQCAITGEFFLVGDSEANHSHLSATVGCVMPGSCNWALGPYETVLDELMIKVYPGDDIEKARSIRRAIHGMFLSAIQALPDPHVDAMRPSFVAYIDGTAPIVQSAQKVVEMLKEDTEMVAWGNAALGDAETCTKFYEELIGGNRPVAVAVKGKRYLYISGRCD